MAVTKKDSRPIFALTITSAFGAGYLPVAPGTFGSAVGLVVWRVLPDSPVAHVAAMVALFAVGSWAGSLVERHLGRTDPSQIVIDEVLGMVATLFLNPVGWTGVCGAFLLFRIADIVKPFPVNRLERLPGGIGVMADDVMAGVYANLVLRAVLALGHLVT